MQVEVVHSTDSEDTHARKPAAPPVHQIAADGTEAVLHHATRRDSPVLSPSGQFVFPADVLEASVHDGEVRAEHGRAEFVAVAAVADEGVD